MQIVDAVIFGKTHLNLNPFNTKHKVEGSKIAKNGFINEDNVIKSFENMDSSAVSWLTGMGYETDKIDGLNVHKLQGYKSDIQLEIIIGDEVFFENIQIKLVSQKSGYNQIDKRWTSKYADLWNMPSDVEHILKLFSGETRSDRKDLRDERRMFLDEFDSAQQNKLLDFFNTHKTQILKSLFMGERMYIAKWILVISKYDVKSIIISMDNLISYYSKYNFTITINGNLKLKDITMQRKGGDRGRVTVNMIQFKANPSKFFDIPV